jgi:hypothetical protein
VVDDGGCSLHTSAVIAFARTCWNHEKSKNMYKAYELFAAVSIFELPMGMFMAVIVYLVRNSPRYRRPGDAIGTSSTLTVRRPHDCR